MHSPDKRGRPTKLQSETKIQIQQGTVPSPTTEVRRDASVSIDKAEGALDGNHATSTTPKQHDPKGYLSRSGIMHELEWSFGKDKLVGCCGEASKMGSWSSWRFCFL